jgi:hypothetical protein
MCKAFPLQLVSGRKIEQRSILFSSIFLAVQSKMLLNITKNHAILRMLQQRRCGSLGEPQRIFLHIAFCLRQSLKAQALGALEMPGGQSLSRKPLARWKKKILGG